MVNCSKELLKVEPVMRCCLTFAQISRTRRRANYKISVEVCVCLLKQCTVHYINSDTLKLLNQCFLNSTL